MCDGHIQKGQRHNHVTDRRPVFDSEETQISIKYTSYRQHNYSCLGAIPWLTKEDYLKQKECKKGSHDFIEEQEFDHYCGNWKVGAPTGRTICKHCGIDKPIIKNK